MSIIIRKAVEKDIPKIVDFQIRMAKETEDYDLDRDTVSKGVRHLFELPVKGQYWVAEESGKTIASTLTIPEWSDWRNGTVIWIHSVYVIKEFRGKGVFKTLYNYLKEIVEQDETLMGLRLYVEKENTNAQKVYEKLGMNADHYLLYEWMKNF